MDRIAPRFARYEPVRRAAGLMLGMLSDLDRKNCWTIAEHRGDVTPDGLQHLLSRARWDADAVRDDVRGYVIDAFGESDAVLVVDETGDVKKGVHSVGVQRQYTGTAGRIENAQVAVFLTYAARRGHALIDRALYLPRSWIEDPDRCAAAGIPAQTGFATKPALATELITRTVYAGVPAAWVAGDEVYGADPTLRRTVRQLGLGYVLQAAANRRVPTAAGPIRVDHLPGMLPTHAWQQYSAGAGSKGHRIYSWAWIALPPEDPDETGQHHLLIRRNDTTGELAYLRCYSPHPVPLATLVRVAGQRWRIEESFQAAKRPHRPRPAPGPPLDLLAPLDHPSHARPRLPGRGHRHRTRPRASTGRNDRTDRQRIPAAVRRTAARRPAHHQHPAGLVNLASTTPSPRPRMPLPTPRDPMITNYGCRTSASACPSSMTSSGPKIRKSMAVAPLPR
jgi:SRSO17 transposase